MERMVAPVIEAIWRKVVESFSSKVVEQTVDDALNSVNNVRDFELIFGNLKKNLKSLSAKAADVEEEIMNRELSGRKKRKREVKEWLEEVESIKQVVVELGSQIESEGFVTRLTDGGKAAQLDEQVKELVEQSHNFGELFLDVCGTSGDIFLTNGLVGQTFNENLETILRLLEGTEVSSIGVYGMGGVGKTTLVQHINNRFLQRSEGRVFWVTVSHEFTIKSLQEKIARCVGVDLSDEDHEDKRASKLHKALSAMKNSVLILDDVWDYIDVLKVGCSVSTQWCRLIITTRSFGVCRQMGCQRKIPIEKLNEGEAWKLFNERLGNEKELDPEVEGIARSMVKLCGGLPLAIITVAGSMRGKRGIHRWRNDFRELQGRVKEKDGMDNDEVFEVLKFSFDRLKKRNDKSNGFNTKQLCFLYCSLYPEDYEIPREGLVRNFISEGLLDERKSRRSRVDQGHSILDELVDVCLLESCVDICDKECVKMHDLVRSMALKICEEKYMVRAGDWTLKEIPYNEEEWTKDLEKASFMQFGICGIEEGFSPDCPKLSTLLMWDNQNLRFIPESFFSKMQGLCTLNLCGSQIRKLPNSISDLTSLKALLLEDCDMLKKVPYLGKLKALRDLNLSGTAIKEAPQGLEELLKLRFLSIDARGLKMLPRGLLLKLGHLRHLNLPLHIQIEEIKNLKQVEEFGGRLKSTSDFNWFITTRGVHDHCYKIVINSKKSSLFNAEVRLGCDKNALVLCEGNLKDEKVFGQGIAYLTIYGCEGLSKCFVDDLTERFNNPTSLRKLTIWRCGGIEWILRSDGQGSQFSNTLEDIHLYSLDDLKRVVMERAEIGASIAPTHPAMFSSLRRLHIINCNKMRKLGLAVTGLPNLECISIDCCEEIEGIFEEDERRAASIITTLPKFNSLRLNYLPRLRKVGLHIQEIPNLTSIFIRLCGEIEEIFEEDEGRATSVLTRLQLLTLEDLPKLKSVSKPTIISNSIRDIYIRKCPRLMNKLPVHIDGPTPPSTLESIEVDKAWWESLEWDININPNLPRLLQNYVEFVEDS